MGSVWAWGLVAGVLAGWDGSARPQEGRQGEGPTLTIEGVIDAQMAEVAGGMARLFFEEYPKLLERFENPQRPAPRRTRLEFRERMRVPAFCTGDRVVVSVGWLREHPEDLGMLTHELTHAVQSYPPGGPAWLVEGIADYARKLYGPAVQPGWALPEKLGPKQSYRDGYRVTARFLEWLDSAYPGTVDKVHRSLQEGMFREEIFSEWTGKSLEGLWEECLGALGGQEGAQP